MKHFLTMLLITVLLCVPLKAQKTTVVVKDYFETQKEGTLNDAVTAAIQAGTLSNTVFKLNPYGVYVLTGSIITPPGQVLEITADPPGKTQTTAPPMICWTASTAPSKTYLFDVAGEVKMSNVWILWSSLDGTRFSSTIRVGDSSSVSGGKCEFNNVIFDYVKQASSGAIQPFATKFKGIFRNCYFRNAMDEHFRYYSRAVSFPFSATGLHTESVLFENCTFANIGYVYMQEAANYGDRVQFNHCTFYNVMMFTLESGWWWKMNVTNSLFINTYMFGRIPASDREGFGGTINITAVDSFGFQVPFKEQDRRILFSNNNYYVEQWLVDWMGYGPNGNPYSKQMYQTRQEDLVPKPQPAMNSGTKRFFDSTDASGKKVFPHMVRAKLDSLNPGFINPPINLPDLKTFLHYKWDNNADIGWAWKPEQYSTNGGQVWPLVENLAYTNATLKTAAMGGYPLGDLRWWPDQYTQWVAQQAESERKYINDFLDQTTSGVKESPDGIIPTEYTLDQNYPNPFNPTTQINYSIPEAGHVSLKVFNSLGQEVATIFEGQQQAGKYIATFNGTGLASGAYIYKLQTKNVSLSKKFMLVK